MAWRYAARDGNGRRISGLLELEGRQEALDELFARGLTPLFVKPARQAASTLSYERAARLASELSRLSASGLPLETALSLTAGAELHASTRAALELAARKLADGSGPAAAFASLEGPAGRIMSAAIRAGERNGNLAQALSSITPVLAATAQFRSRFSTLMLYPSAIAATSLVFLAIFFLYVLPTLRPILERAEDTNGSAQWLMGLSDAMPFLLGTLAMGLTAAVVLLRFPDIKAFAKGALDRMALSRFSFGLVRSNETALFARLYGALLGSGAPAADAISEAAGALSNTVLKARLETAAEAVREGARQSEALAEALGEDDLIVRAALIGDRASLAAPLVLEAGNVLVERAAQKLERAAAIAAPSIIIILGVVIGVIVASVFSALASLPEAISP